MTQSRMRLNKGLSGGLSAIAHYAGAARARGAARACGAARERDQGAHQQVLLRFAQLGQVGMRGDIIASISPLSIMVLSVVSGLLSIKTPAGISKSTRSFRPGCSSPAWTQ